MQNPKIVILGAGNVATHLCKALHKAGIAPTYIYSRNINSAKRIAAPLEIPFGNILEAIPPADLWLFTVTDDALAQITKKSNLKNKVNNALCAHTAGSISQNILSSLSKNTGVLYPIQTFNKNVEINFDEIPILIEANTPKNTCTLEFVAKKISKKISYMHENQRKYLHIAAVFACNFANHQLSIAQEVAQQHDIDFKLLHPLIKETLRKALKHEPQNTQTGPAVRNDKKTLKIHENLLKDLPYIQNIYTFVSANIQYHHNKSRMDNFKARLKDIKAFVFDVDGVLSHTMILHVDGDLMRHMNVKDGFAVKQAIDQNFKIGIITGGDSNSVRIRFEKLGVKDIYLASKNKTADFNDFLDKNNLKETEILYMGDDLPDHPVMKRCRLATCPADAVEEIQTISHYVSDKNGGEGCVRDVIEQVMRAQGKWKIPSQ